MSVTHRINLKSLLPALLACFGICHTALAEDAPKLTFDEHVKPIFRDQCALCHNRDDASSDLALDSYARVMQGGAGGPVIEPGDPSGSRLYLLMSHQETPEMPPESDKLPEETLTTIRMWIEQGALENASSKARIKKKPKLATSGDFSGGKPDGPAAMPEGLSRLAAVYTERGSAVTALASSPWGPLLAVSGQKQILLYHTDTGQLLGVLPFPEGVPHVLRFSRSGALLMAGGGRAAHSGKVVVFDVTTGERVVEVGDELDQVLAADINEDHTLIALGGPSKVVRVYSVEDGSVVGEIRKHTDWIYALEFSPDGVLLATADRNGGLFVWEAATVREYQDLRGHTAAITDVTWRLDSNLLASASEDGTLQLWEMEGGKQVKKWNAHGGGVTSAQFSTDGRLVSTGRDRTVKVWNVEGQEQKSLGPLADLAMKAVFTSDGKRVAAGDWQGNLQLWDLESAEAVMPLATNPPTLETLAQAAAERVAETQKQSEAAAAELAAAEQQLATAAGSAEQAAESATQLAAKAEKLAAAITEAEAPVAESQQKVAAAEAELNKALEALVQARLVLTKTEQTLAAKRQAAEAATAAVTAAQTKREELVAAQAAVQEQVAAKQAAAAEARLAAEAAAADAAAIQAELTATLEAEESPATADTAPDQNPQTVASAGE